MNIFDEVTYELEGYDFLNNKDKPWKIVGTIVELKGSYAFVSRQYNSDRNDQFCPIHNISGIEISCDKVSISKLSK